MSHLTLDVPAPMLDAARKLAQWENLTVEQYLMRMLGEAVRLDAEWEQRAVRGRQISRERFLEILNKAPDVPPLPGDEIE